MALIRERWGLTRIPTEGRGWGDHYLTISLTFTDFHLFLAGGHEDFSKMIDEAEPLGYPVVVKSTRGHRGQCHLSRASWVISPLGLLLCLDKTLLKCCLEKWSSPLRSLQCFFLFVLCSCFCQIMLTSSLNYRNQLLT